MGTLLAGLLLFKAAEEFMSVWDDGGGGGAVILKLGDIRSDTDDDLDEEDAVVDTDADDKEAAFVVLTGSVVCLRGLLLLVLFVLHIVFIWNLFMMSLMEVSKSLVLGGDGGA